MSKSQIPAVYSAAQMNAMFGSVGVDANRKQVPAGRADAYYGFDAESSVGKFKSPGLSQRNVDDNLGAALADAVEQAGVADEFIPSVLRSGALGAIVRLSIAQELRIPFVSQMADQGIATIQVRSEKTKNGKTWAPIGGAKYLEAVAKARSQGDMAEAVSLLRAGAAMGMRKALASHGVKFDANGRITSKDLPYSLSKVTERYSAIPNSMAQAKGQLGQARLVGTHMADFEGSDAAIARFQATGKMKGAKLPGGFKSLKGKTAYPASAGCDVTQSGPGLTPFFRFSPKKLKSGTQYCGSTPHVNPTNSYNIGKRTVGGQFKNLEEYIDTLRAEGVAIKPQYETAAYAAYAADLKNRNLDFYGRAGESRKDATSRVKAAKAAEYVADAAFLQRIAGGSASSSKAPQGRFFAPTNPFATANPFAGLPVDEEMDDA